jgi:hypothetical protein
MTELTPSRLSLGLDLELAGRPIDNGLYKQTDDQLFYYGKRMLTFDGRIFKYGKSGGVLDNDLGVGSAEDEVQTYGTLDATSNVAIGSTQLRVNGGTHAALAKDELIGGFILMYTANNQIRYIVGNDAAEANADFTVYLDAPTSVLLVAASTGVEVFYNPYAKLVATGADGNNILTSKLGIPATKITAANKNFWLQTWGLCWVAPQIANFQAATYLRAGYWRHDGSIDSAAATGVTSTQYAGYFVNEGLTSGPLFYLMCST